MERQSFRRSAPMLTAISGAIHQSLTKEWFAAQVESDEEGAAMFALHNAGRNEMPTGEF